MSWRRRLEEVEADLEQKGQKDSKSSSTKGSPNNSGLGVSAGQLPSSSGRVSSQNDVSFMNVGNVQEFATAGISIAGIFGELIFSHPFLVFRRQCQIRHDSRWLHLTPFSVVPVMRNITIQQGYGTLWKGLSSSCLLRGLGMMTDTVISEVTPLPKEVSRHSSLLKMAQHLMLKGLSFAVCAPFYAASLVEMVQSDIASDPPSFFSCLLHGFRRCCILRVTMSRMLPMWKIMPCVVALELSRYALREIVHSYTALYLGGGEATGDVAASSGEYQDKVTGGETSSSGTTYLRYLADLMGAFMGGLVANVVLYPLETVVHRLCVQGTRIITDNVDTGLEVVPVTTAYDGFMDAVNTITVQEGSAGFYKGFGALVLQYVAHFALLFAVRSCIEHLMSAYTDDSDYHRPRTQVSRKFNPLPPSQPVPTSLHRQDRSFSVGNVPLFPSLSSDGDVPH